MNHSRWRWRCNHFGTITTILDGTRNMVCTRTVMLQIDVIFLLPCDIWALYSCILCDRCEDRSASASHSRVLGQMPIRPHVKISERLLFAVSNYDWCSRNFDLPFATFQSSQHCSLSHISHISDLALNAFGNKTTIYTCIGIIHGIFIFSL